MKDLFYLICTTTLSLCVSFLFVGCGTPDTGPGKPEEKFRDTPFHPVSMPLQKEALTYLNTLRESAGLHPLKRSELLEASAMAHARYLTENDLYTHHEDADVPFFVATTPWQRAESTGYAGTRVVENIYAGDVSGVQAVDILFSDIYHRFAFLDFDIDEIGIAQHFAQNYSFTGVHTFEMGESGERNEVAGSQNGPIVWPYAGQKDVMPVFYEEEPDPLPDCSVSGYPVSVSFDPKVADETEIESLELFDEKDMPVKDVFLLDQQSDPNHRLGKNQLALMPLQRLGWGKQYRVRLVYADSVHRKRTLTWEFETRDLDGRVYEVVGEKSEFTVKSGETCFFYLPPRHCNDRFERYRYRYSPTLMIEEEMIDHNTIKLRVKGKGYIEMMPDNGRHFFVTVL